MSQALFKCTGNIPVYLKLILLVRESTINKYTHRQGTLWISFIGLLRNCFDYQILLLYNKRQDRHTHPNVPDSSSQLFQILNQAPNLNHHLSIQTWASPMSPISANGQDWTENHPWHSPSFSIYNLISNWVYICPQYFWNLSFSIHLHSHPDISYQYFQPGYCLSLTGTCT